LLSYWYDDVTTRAVALYVESFGNPRRFTWLARALSTGKPILAVKSGRSVGGRRAGTSHTAAAAAPDVAVDTLFRQAGVLRMDTLGELLDAARLLTEQPLPAGDRVAIVGNAGGLNVLAADAAGAAKLEIVELSAALQLELAGVAPHLAGVSNPVDLGADAPPATIGKAIRALASSGEADALVVTLVATRTNDLPGALAALTEAADDEPQLPIVAIVVGADSPLKLGRGSLPVYQLPEDAVRSLKHACRYARWRREPAGNQPTLPGIDRHAAHRIVAAALTEGAGWQPVAITHALMACYGVPLLDTRLATNGEQAEAVARDLGFPVVMKATRPGLVHKTEAGGVHLGLSHESAVRAAYLNIAGSLDEAQPEAALQPMVQTAWSWSLVYCTMRSLGPLSWWAWAAYTPTCSAIGHSAPCHSLSRMLPRCGASSVGLHCSWATAARQPWTPTHSSNFSSGLPSSRATVQKCPSWTSTQWSQSLLVLRLSTSRSR
jgi:acyl-CoA synthetase (NDP forming)